MLLLLNQNGPTAVTRPGGNLDSIESPTAVTMRRSVMWRALSTIAAPFFAIGVVALVVAFPTPYDLAEALRPVPDNKPVAAGGPSVEKVVTDLSSGLPEAVTDRSLENADCFQNLAIADKAKLDRCAEFAYQTLIDVQQHADNPAVQQTFQTADNKRFFQQLKLAAAEVCRIQWAGQGGKTRYAVQTPACTAAEVKLASDVD